jgi:hypothetical protein
VAKQISLWDEFSLEDISESDNEILQSVKEYTMTSPERVFSMLEAVRYVIKNNLPGGIVECGVWRGGTMMAMARLLLMQQNFEKDLYLFDTFEGMPSPADVDTDFRGRKAKTTFLAKKREEDSSNWCYASLPEVQRNLDTIGYPRNKIHYIVGKVEKTIPEQAPEKISILRLDTDWYESTKHELIHLYPRLVQGGVLIIDDYGHWQGARKAVDEYFDQNKVPILFNRIDYTGRIAIKLL